MARSSLIRKGFRDRPRPDQRLFHRPLCGQSNGAGPLLRLQDCRWGCDLRRHQLSVNPHANWVKLDQRSCLSGNLLVERTCVWAQDDWLLAPGSNM